MMETDVRIISDPEVMMGKPIIEGTRVTVEIILEKLASGESMHYRYRLILHTGQLPAAAIADLWTTYNREETA